ncbi:MAG: OadG family protein [Treponema sp.]|jgi:oxaloacetate decarboxylase gamma subunit|nr:OadG family protein [Treponema sp.]
MNITEMFEQSAVLTLLGMGVVFGFLIILVVAITGMGKIVHAMGLDKEPEVAKPKAPLPAPAAVVVASVVANQDSAITAAISAAVSTYRKNHN